MTHDIEDQRRAKVTKIIRTNPCGLAGNRALRNPISAKGIMQ